MAFHDAIPLAEYNFDELVSYGTSDLNTAMSQFFELVQDAEPPVVEATFAVCYGYFIDLARSECPLSPKSKGAFVPPTDFSLQRARENLVQSVASKRPSVKLKKMTECIRAISESDTTEEPVTADALLENLARIVPTVPLLATTMVLMRAFLNYSPDRSLSIGPEGYAVTTIEAVLGSFSVS
jgi:hypothetical protein